MPRRGPKLHEARFTGHWVGPVAYASVTCKHGGRFLCRECGTGERDAVHTTRGGRGVVGRLMSKRGA
jgi:hypothetical protein